MPMTVSSAPATRPNASSVWMVFCMAVVVLRAEITRDDYARTHRNAVDQTDHQENQVAGGADRGQRLTAQKVADDQRIRRVVQLLKQVAQKQREREGDQRLRNRPSVREFGV